MIYYSQDLMFSSSEPGSLENYYSSMTFSQNGYVDQMRRHYVPASPPSKQAYVNRGCILGSQEQFGPGHNGASRPNPIPADTSVVKEVQPSISSSTGEICTASSRGSNLTSNIIEEHVNGSLDFEQYFQEGYCRPSDLNRCPDSVEAIVDADGSGSPCDRDKSEEDGDNDDMLGGVFAFSE